MPRARGRSPRGGPAIRGGRGGRGRGRVHRGSSVLPSCALALPPTADCDFKSSSELEKDMQAMLARVDDLRRKKEQQEAEERHAREEAAKAAQRAAIQEQIKRDKALAAAEADRVAREEAQRIEEELLQYRGEENMNIDYEDDAEDEDEDDGSSNDQELYSALESRKKAGKMSSSNIDLDNEKVKNDIQSLTNVLIQMQTQMGIEVEKVSKFSPILQDPLELTVEQRLQAVCQTPVAPLGFWNHKPEEPDYTGEFPMTGEIAKDLKTIANMLQVVMVNQHRLYDNDEMMMSVLKLLSQGQLETLSQTHSVRSLVGGKDADTTIKKILKNYESHMQWFADKNLATVPFRSVREIETFFKDPTKICALQRYVLTYTKYNPSTFPRIINELCIHSDLRDKIYWSTKTMRDDNADNILPEVYEHFVILMAKCAHEHVFGEDGGKFDLVRFRSQCRRVFYNYSKRNPKVKSNKRKEKFTPPPSRAKKYCSEKASPTKVIQIKRKGSKSAIVESPESPSTIAKSPKSPPQNRESPESPPESPSQIPGTPSKLVTPPPRRSATQSQLSLKKKEPTPRKCQVTPTKAASSSKPTTSSTRTRRSPKRIDASLVGEGPLTHYIEAQFKEILRAVKEKDKTVIKKVVAHINSAVNKIDPAGMSTRLRVDAAFATKAIKQRLHTDLVNDSLHALIDVFSQHPYEDLLEDSTDVDEEESASEEHYSRSHIGEASDTPDDDDEEEEEARSTDDERKDN